MNSEINKKICEMCSVNPAILYGKTHLEIYAYMCENCFKFYGVKLASTKEENILDEENLC